MIFAALALATELPPPQAKGPEIVIITDAGPALQRLPAKPENAPDPVAKQAGDKYRQCIKRWTTLNYGAHMADAVSTHVAVSAGGSEGNPLQRIIIGKKPSFGEVAAFKVASMGLFQFGLSRLPNDEERCTALRINTMITFGLSTLHWRALF